MGQIDPTTPWTPVWAHARIAIDVASRAQIIAQACGVPLAEIYSRAGEYGATSAGMFGWPREAGVVRARFRLTTQTVGLLRRAGKFSETLRWAVRIGVARMDEIGSIEIGRFGLIEPRK